jgi:hypothetical protein
MATNVFGSTWSTTRPIDFANCTLWMDGSDPTTVTVTNGNQLTKWVDKTSNAYQFTCAANASLTYTTVSSTNPIKQFTMGGTQGVLECTTCSIAPTFTIIASGKITTTDYSRIVGSNTSPNLLLFGGHGQCLSTGVGNWYILNDFGPTASSSIINPSVFCANHDATSKIMNGYVNGTKLDATTAYSSSSPLLTMTGINLISGGQAVAGNTSEIIIYSGILSDTSRTYLEGYLAWKYGTQSSIVSGHLYKSSPPIGLAVWNP